MEAARVDGAGHAKIFRRIVLPLIVPALASFAIFQFLWVWNDLLVALIFAGGTDETAPLTVRLARAGRHPGQRVAAADLRRVRLDRRPADRLPVPAALLRPRPAGGSVKG